MNIKIIANDPPALKTLLYLSPNEPLLLTGQAVYDVLGQIFIIQCN